MGKTKEYVIKEKESYDYYYDFQKVVDEDGKVLFDVYNLAECPEDAIIGRSLFDAYDWVNAVRFGIELAKQGVDGIELTIEKVDSDED